MENAKGTTFTNQEEKIYTKIISKTFANNDVKKFAGPVLCQSHYNHLPQIQIRLESERTRNERLQHIVVVSME